MRELKHGNRKNETWHSMILAAGEGRRLRPLTAAMPKPLVPVGELPLIANVMLNMHLAGIANFAINTHHRGTKLEDYLKNCPFAEKISIYPEKTLLGTGGPLLNAREQLAEADAFLLHNGDIITDFNLKHIMEEHLQSGALATLLLCNATENRVRINPAGEIIDILDRLNATTEQSQVLTYTGIAAFSPEVFKYWTESAMPVSLVDLLLPLIEAHPGRIHATIMPKAKYWNDIGTLARYFSALEDIRLGKIKLPTNQGFAGARCERIAEQGSSRIFHRISNDDENYVLMQTNRDDPDFGRFIEIGGNLYHRGLGTPKIIATATEQYAVLMEDLGNKTLFRCVCEIRSSTESSEQQKISLRKLYLPVLDFLIRLQCNADKENIRKFDYDYLRWESNYFQENCLRGEYQLQNKDLTGLDAEFHALAEKVINQPQVFIHRDFQSQNIIFRDGQVRIVDFQGARIGQISYDLVSLLYDPYAKLPNDLKDELGKVFHQKLTAAGMTQYSPGDFAEFAVCAGLQRTMQALGAFCFLAREKGKLSYLNYIPAGIHNLRDLLLKLDSLKHENLKMPTLNKIAQSLKHHRKYSQ